MLRSAISPRRLRLYTRRDLHRIPQLRRLRRKQREAVTAVSAVLPFRVNNYVLEELIDWGSIPSDPIFQLTFPQPGMLAAADLEVLLELVRCDAPAPELRAVAHTIQEQMNPHPAGQMDLNVPVLDDTPLPGLQHKYRETVLFFPCAGQTCHAFCTYCFRWAQFVGVREFRLQNRDGQQLIAYLHRHPEVTDVLFTGGDPMVMSARRLRAYIAPLLRMDSLTSIRIGTKALAWWPHRFVTDRDADDLLHLFEDVRNAGKQLAFMTHSSHPRELSTPVAKAAVQRVRDAGAVIRSQAPIIRHVNDSAAVWADLWRQQARLGIVPYYVFVARDTGAKRYFDLPLSRALEIYEAAVRQLSGLGRTARGPSMSASPGKVLVAGTTSINGERLFVLKMLQGRDPSWAGRVFLAEYDPHATWLDELRPAGGETEFFFEPAMRLLRAQHLAGRSPLRCAVNRGQ